MRIKDLLVPSNVVAYKTPIVVNKTFTDQLVSASNWIVTPPTRPIAGNLLLVFTGVIQSRVPAIAGWTDVDLPTYITALGHRFHWKVSDGTETSITVNLGGLSQGCACYYEIENVDTTLTFYDAATSANQAPGGPYTSAVSNPYVVTRPSVVFSSAVFIGSGSDWSPNNGFIYNGTRLSATAHKIFTAPAASSNVTWSRVGGSTSSTKINMIEIFGKVNTDPSISFQ